MNQIKKWWYKVSLKMQKEKAIYEISQDMKYIETFKGGMLSYDESKARRRMAELKKIPDESKTEIQHQELEHVLDVISKSKATKQEYERSKAVLGDLKDYISIL